MIDLKTRRDRIGYHSLYKKMAYAIGIAGMFTTLLMIMATAFITMGTKTVEAHTQLKNTIYLNVKHK